MLDKRLNEINELDKKVNRDDLVYIYKKKESPNEEFDEYGNASDLFDKIKNW